MLRFRNFTLLLSHKVNFTAIGKAYGRIKHRDFSSCYMLASNKRVGVFYSLHNHFSISSSAYSDWKKWCEHINASCDPTMIVAAGAANYVKEIIILQAKNAIEHRKFLQDMRVKLKDKLIPEFDQQLNKIIKALEGIEQNRFQVWCCLNHSNYQELNGLFDEVKNLGSEIQNSCAVIHQNLLQSENEIADNVSKTDNDGIACMAVSCSLSALGMLIPVTAPIILMGVFCSSSGFFILGLINYHTSYSFTKLFHNLADIEEKLINFDTQLANDIYRPEKMTRYQSEENLKREKEKMIKSLATLEELKKSIENLKK